jgi:hypothetical protein
MTYRLLWGKVGYDPTTLFHQSRKQDITQSPMPPQEQANRNLGKRIGSFWFRADFRLRLLDHGFRNVREQIEVRNRQFRRKRKGRGR